MFFAKDQFSLYLTCSCFSLCGYNQAWILVATDRSHRFLFSLKNGFSKLGIWPGWLTLHAYGKWLTAGYVCRYRYRRIMRPRLVVYLLVGVLPRCCYCFEALLFLACFLLMSLICKLPSTDSLLLVAGAVFSLYLSVFNEGDFCVSFSSVLLFEV